MFEDPSTNLDVKAMQECVLDEQHHPEGALFDHAMMVYMQVVEMSDRIPKDWYVAFLWAALVHDIGMLDVNKAIRKLQSLTPGEVLDPKEEKAMRGAHGKVGVPLAQDFLHDFDIPEADVEKILALVEHHDRILRAKDFGPKAFRRLHKEVPLDVLVLFGECDHRGRAHPACSQELDFIQPCLDFLKAEEEKAAEPKPHIDARFLMGLGMEPGPQIGAALVDCKNYQLANNSSVEEMEAYARDRYGS
jgi:tRNA nucleotidyltransferase (CCA-adding enzyme)